MNEAAKKIALRIIERRDVSRKMLLDKLTEKGISIEDSEEVADWLCGLGVINDARFAELVVRHYVLRGMGRQRIKDELFRRGIDKELWDDALESIPPSNDAIYRLLSARLSRTECSPSDYQRAAAYLQRRGFAWDEIREAIDKYQEEKKENL